MASAPLSVETWKNFEKLERLWTFKTCPKTFPKTLFERVLIDFFHGEKICPVHPGDSKKIHKNRKKLKFQKCPKNVPKSVQTSFEVIFWNCFDQCTLECREVEKIQRIWKKFQIFNKSRKRFQKCPSFLWGDFFRFFLDQCTLEIKTCKNSKKKL